MKKLLLAALLATSAVTHAALETEIIGTDSSGNMWEIYPSTLKQVGNVTKVWIMVSYIKSAADKVASTKALWEFICGQEKVGLNELIKYDKNGTVVKAGSMIPEYNSIVPDSMGAATYARVCR